MQVGEALAGSTAGSTRATRSLKSTSNAQAIQRWHAIYIQLGRTTSSTSRTSSGHCCTSQDCRHAPAPPPPCVAVWMFVSSRDCVGFACAGRDCSAGALARVSGCILPTWCCSTAKPARCCLSCRLFPCNSCLPVTAKHMQGMPGAHNSRSPTPGPPAQ